MEEKIRDILGTVKDKLSEPAEEANLAAKKKVVKGATTAIVALSILSGLAFSGPAEINQSQIDTQLNQTPVVLDIDDYMSTNVDDDDDDADEQKGSKIGVVAKFKQAVLQLPQAVRLLIITPLWAVGTALMTAVSFLWNVIFSSPLGTFIASFAIGFGVLVALFAVTAKMLLPGVPLKKMLNKKTVLALGVTALLLAGVDAIAPMYWHEYPAISAVIKLGVGASVIALIITRFKKLLTVANPFSEGVKALS